MTLMCLQHKQFKFTIIKIHSVWCLVCKNFELELIFHKNMYININTQTSHKDEIRPLNNTQSIGGYVL